MQTKTALKIALVLGAVLLLNACVTRPQSYETASDIELVRELLVIPEFPGWNPEDLEAQAREDITTPINFYVKIVNNKEQPIAGLAIEYTLLNRVLEPFDYPYYGWVNKPKIFTDKNGFIAIEETGAAIAARIKTDSYWNDEGLSGLFYYAPRLLELNTVTLPTDKTQPAVVVLVSKPREAFIQKISTGAISTPNGQSVAVKLPAQQRYSNTETDFTIQLDEAAPDATGRYRWSICVVVPDGGIQAVKNLPDIYAPQDGYRSRYQFTMTEDDPAWDHRRDFYFYLKTAAGNYAIIELKVRTAHENFVAIEGNYNAHGVPIIN